MKNNEMMMMMMMMNGNNGGSSDMMNMMMMMNMMNGNNGGSSDDNNGGSSMNDMMNMMMMMNMMKNGNNGGSSNCIGGVNSFMVDTVKETRSKDTYEDNTAQLTPNEKSPHYARFDKYIVYYGKHVPYLTKPQKDRYKSLAKSFGAKWNSEKGMFEFPSIEECSEFMAMDRNGELDKLTVKTVVEEKTE